MGNYGEADDHWGAKVVYPLGSPYDPQNRYHPLQPLEGVTSRGSGATIGEINRQIMAQHPEDIAVLADQWQNAYNLLDGIRQQVAGQAEVLANQLWQSPAARDEFLKAGPGTTLAYLDAWRDAALRNFAVLRSLVGIARESRGEMASLYDEYLRAKQRAHDVTFLENLAANWVPRRWNRTWDEAREDHIVDQLREVQEHYDGEAQKLAFRVANDYVRTLGSELGGFGPKFLPMDVVLNPVDMPRGALGGPPSPGGPAGIAPLAPSPVPQLPFPGVAPLASPLVAIPVPGVPTGAAPLAPSPAPGLPFPGVAPFVPPLAAMPAAAVRTPSPAGGRVPTPMAGRQPGTVPATGPRNAVLGRLDQRSSAGVEPSPALRAPAAPAPPPPPGRRGAKPAREPGKPQVRGPAPSEDAFSTPTGTAAPPVLRSTRPTETSSRRVAPSAPTTASAGRPTGTPPPVLGAPARPAPSEPGQGRRSRASQVRPGESDQDCLGLDGLRAGAGSGVVDAPAPATGAAHEVPRALRATRNVPSAVVPGDLSARKAPTQPPSAPDDEISQPVVTDEEAFTVDTPGGAVVAKNRAEPGYRPEPPTALSAR